MPQIIDIEGVGPVEFEDSMTDEDITRAIEEEILPSMNAQAPPMNAQAPQQAPSFLESALVGTGRGGQSFKEGLQQAEVDSRDLMSSGFVNAPDSLKPAAAALLGPYFAARSRAPVRSQPDITQEAQAGREFYAQTPVGQSTVGKVAAFVGEIAPTIPVSGPRLVGNLLYRALGELGLNALFGAGEFVPEGGSRAQAAGASGLFGFGGKVGLDVAGAAGAKAINAARGVPDPRIADLADTAAREQVPLFAADVTTNPMLKKAGTVLEDVPVIGARGQRLAQNKAAQVAAERRGENLLDEAIAIEYGGSSGLNKLKAAASGSGPRQKQAAAVLAQVDAAGDDWTRIIQSSGNVSLFHKQMRADDLYDRVATLATQYGQVPANNVSRALADGLQQIARPGLRDAPTEKVLTELADVFSGPLDYDDMRRIRSQVADAIEDAKKGANAAVGTTGTVYLAKVRDAVERDMDAFATSQGPELRQAWKAADGFYKAKVAPYKEASLARALRKADPDEIFNLFIKRGKGDRAQRFYNALDGKGRAAVRYGLVASALDASIRHNALNGVEDLFSPAIFDSTLDRFSEASGVFFKGAAKKDLDGFKNLMRAVQQAGQVAANPMTGARNVPLLITGGGLSWLYADPTSAGMAAATTLLAKSLITTDAGRRILYASSTVALSSPAMAKLLERASSLGARAAGQVGAQSGVQRRDSGSNQ